MKTPYDVLGVRRFADDATIRAALRKAAKTYHPDLNADNPDAEQHLREVIAAYEMLRNPQQRATYDQFLRSQRRGKIRRLATTALVSASLVSAGTLALTAWLSSAVEHASQSLHHLHVATEPAKGAEDHAAAAAAHAKAQRAEPGGGDIDPHGDSSNAKAQQHAPSVAVAGMVIRPANGQHAEPEVGGTVQDEQAKSGETGAGGTESPPTPDSTADSEGTTSTDRDASATDIETIVRTHPEGDGADSGADAAAAQQRALANEWTKLQTSTDLLAIWAFAARHAETPLAELAQQRLIDLIDAAADVRSLATLQMSAIGPIAEAAQRRLVRLGSDDAQRGLAPQSEPEFHLARALVWLRQGNFDRAITDLDKAIRLAPGNALAYSWRANAWGGKGEQDRALADFEAALRLDPDSPVPFRERGILWRRTGALDRALVDLDRAIRLGFSDARAYHERGLVWHAKGSHERAIADFDRAIKLDPTLAAAYTNRGIALRSKGDLDRAIASFDAAIRIDPRAYAAYYHRGHAHSDKLDFEQASADYAKARELMPNAHIR